MLCSVSFFLSLTLNFSSSLSKLPLTIHLPLYAGHSVIQGNGGAHWRPGTCMSFQDFSLLSPSPPDFLLQAWVALTIVKEVLQNLIHTLFNSYLLSVDSMSDKHLLCMRQHWAKPNSCPYRAYLLVRKQRRGKFIWTCRWWWWLSEALKFQE